jgi:hypothetical protein
VRLFGLGWEGCGFADVNEMDILCDWSDGEWERVVDFNVYTQIFVRAS